MFHMDLYNAKCIIGLDRKDNMNNVYFFYKSTLCADVTYKKIFDMLDYM